MMYRHVVRSTLGVLFLLGILFVAAGSLWYPPGWIFAGISCAGLLVNLLSTGRDEELARERSKPGGDVPAWDRKILRVSALLTLLAYVVAGLDSGRFHWSIPPFAGATAGGVALMITGQGLFALAKHQNSFFSSVVRLQHDRNQTVCNRGLYAVVRHPGYLGMILSWIGFPLVLESGYSAIPALAAAALLVVRADLEDRFLQQGLPGYAEYVQKTRYRILPGVW